MRSIGEALGRTTLEALARVTGLGVCYHDYTGGDLREVVGLELLNHTGVFCSAVKAKAGSDRVCAASDMGQVQARLASHDSAFVKVCHAGVCELVLPVHGGTALAGAVFVGPFRWPEGEPYPGDVLDGTRPRHAALSAVEAVRLPAVGPDRVADIVSLGQAVVECVEARMGTSAEAEQESGYPERIERFMRARASSSVQLADLASALYLSESRASQLVRKHFDETFPQMVTRQRLKLAERLLVQTQMTVSAVAGRVGFEDPTYFHRVFRSHHGVTPLQYRRQHRGSDWPRGV